MEEFSSRTTMRIFLINDPKCPSRLAFEISSKVYPQNATQQTGITKAYKNRFSTGLSKR